MTSILPHWIPAIRGMNIVGSALLSALPPPDVPGDGIRVLQSIDSELTQCSKNKHLAKAHSSSATLDLALSDASMEDEFSLPVYGGAGVKRSRRREAFVCAAGCSARELQLEMSLAPWADWPVNFSGMTMLLTLQGFCEGQKIRESKDPFIIAVLWRGDIYFKACGAPDIWHPGLYLIGPEDLSMVAVFLIGAQRVATLPPGPIAFGMYLSDYTTLVDHHLVGPGLPMFAYLSRATSWAIPFPSSFTVYSSQEIEELARDANLHNMATGQPKVVQKPWHMKHSKAYWIGTVTGPWEFQMDASLLAIPRLKFLRLAKEHPKQLHAEWSSLAGYGIAWIEDKDKIAGFLAPRSRSVQEVTGINRSGFKAVDAWTSYKYYLNLDGVVLGGRLNKLMALGGVVLQHQAGYIEHFDALIKPYEHYVPVAYDLSDLLSKVEWLQKNDAEAQRIAKRAKALAAERMRLEDHICYIWRALEALGAKTASIDVNATAVDKHLSDDGFKRLTVKEGGMRPTLESFWGKKLEDVWTGQRRMHPRGIKMLQWVWGRFEKLNAQAQRA